MTGDQITIIEPRTPKQRERIKRAINKLDKLSLSLRVKLYVIYIFKQPFEQSYILLKQLNRPTIWLWLWAGMAMLDGWLRGPLPKWKIGAWLGLLLIIHLWRQWLIGEYNRRYREEHNG